MVAIIGHRQILTRSHIYIPVHVSVVRRNSRGNWKPNDNKIALAIGEICLEFEARQNPMLNSADWRREEKIVEPSELFRARFSAPLLSDEINVGCIHCTKA